MAAAEVKQLREILQEQQEPFVLQTFLVEKGCCVREKHSNSLGKEDGSFTCCRGISGKKGQKGVSNLSKVVRNLYNQVGSINGKKKKKKKKKQSSEAEAAAERLSFASCSSPNFNWCYPEGENVEDRASCSSSFSEFCNSNGEKIAADGSLQWRCMEDENEQFSPVSVLEGLATHEEEDSSPPSNSREGIIRKKKEEKLSQFSVDESIIASASVWGVLLQRAMSRAETQPTETGDSLKSSSSSSEQRKKRLLFDCIQEAVELDTDYHGSSTKERSSSSERTMKMRSWAWSRRCRTGDESELLSDFVVVQREWSDEDDGEQRREIGLEIGDAILEEIKDEIIFDLIGY